MIEADNLERSVTAALQVNEREVDHLIRLKQLRRMIEEGLAKDLAEDHGLVPGQLPWETAIKGTSQDFKKRAATANPGILLSEILGAKTGMAAFMRW
jgi:hypothetical protein